MNDARIKEIALELVGNTTKRPLQRKRALPILIELREGDHADGCQCKPCAGLRWLLRGYLYDLEKGVEMPRKPLKKFTAWSISRYQDFINCELKAYLKHLLKIDTGIPPGPALERGQEIHTKAEKYVVAKKAPKIPQELELFEEKFKHLRKIRKKVRTEGKLGATSKWVWCDFFDWAKCWVRGVFDAAYYSDDLKVLKIIDYKTGKIRDSHTEQMDLYCILGFALADSEGVEIETVEAELWYLDQGEDRKKSYTRADAEKLKKVWDKKTKKMLATTKFTAKPNRLCAWCEFSKSKSGHCKY